MWPLQAIADGGGDLAPFDLFLAPQRRQLRLGVQSNGTDDHTAAGRQGGKGRRQNPAQGRSAAADKDSLRVGKPVQHGGRLAENRFDPVIDTKFLAVLPQQLHAVLAFFDGMNAELRTQAGPIDCQGPTARPQIPSAGGIPCVQPGDGRKADVAFADHAATAFAVGGKILVGYEIPPRAPRHFAEFEDDHGALRKIIGGRGRQLARNS